jgi:hypothetical protein
MAALRNVFFVGDPASLRCQHTLWSRGRGPRPAFNCLLRTHWLNTIYILSISSSLAALRRMAASFLETGLWFA